MDLKEVISRLEKYCSFSEKCKKDIFRKLYEWKIYNNHEKIINSLTENNYLNEERYALHYCKGKFNSRRWGKIKITSHLKNKGLDMITINKGLNEISNTSYVDALSSKITSAIVQENTEISNAILKNSMIGNYVLYNGPNTQQEVSVGDYCEIK